MLNALGFPIKRIYIHLTSKQMPQLMSIVFLASRRNPLNLVCGESARHSNESSLSRVRSRPSVTLGRARGS